MNMASDDRKLTYSERDRLRREGGGPGGRPRGRKAQIEDEKRSREALAVADSLFTDEKGGQEGKALADAVRAAHGTPELADACRAYLAEMGPPKSGALLSIFLDADDKALSVAALDELLSQKDAGELELDGGLKRQVRILSEGFDDDLASRAEDLLE
jgi:hypothetical protein